MNPTRRKFLSGVLAASGLLLTRPLKAFAEPEPVVVHGYWVGQVRVIRGDGYAANGSYQQNPRQVVKRGGHHA